MLSTNDVATRLRHIEILTKRLLQTSLAGDYRSSFKGSGLEFDQLREYQVGDDVRRIDWRSSMRSNKIMVKEHIEERDRQVIFLVDVSASGNYSSAEQLRRQTMAEVASILASIAEDHKDRVGLLLFSDQVEHWLPPKRGRVHLYRLQRDVLSFEPQRSGTNINAALSFLLKQKGSNAIVFILSDWIDDQDKFARSCRIIGGRHDCIALRFIDPVEEIFPDCGIISLRDPETRQKMLLHTGAATSFLGGLKRRLYEQKQLFISAGMDHQDIVLGSSFVSPLISLFHRRKHARRR